MNVLISFIRKEMRALANKAYKFRIYPTEEQKVLIAKTFGCVRFVYNFFLNKRKDTYRAVKKSLSYSFCTSYLTFLKKTEELSFLNEVDSIALQQALRHLDTSYDNFFKRGKGYPKPKSKHDSKQSYSTVNVNGNISLNNGHIKLPKLGLVKIKQHRAVPTDYKLKSATISVTSTGKYYVSILFEYENQVLQEVPKDFLGLDYSMHELYVDSDGNCPEYPRYYRNAEKKLAKVQRKLSLLTKGSKNYEKQRIRVAKLHEKVSHQRKDFLHKLSRQLADKYDCICIESLNMQAMSKSLHFGKSVHDNGWGMFITFLQYKLEEQGKHLIKVDKFFASSQTCNKCGYRNPETKDLSVREWTCPSCNTHHDRDVNAAINIKNEGIRIISCS